MGEDVAELIDRDTTCDALRVYNHRLARLLQSGANPGALAVGTWTIGDVANHLVWGIENYALWLDDKDAPDLDAIKNMPQWNIDTVRKLPPPHLPRIAGRLTAATDHFIQAAQAIDPSTEVRWYAGNRIPIQVAVCMRLGEAVIHGLDIARACRTKWMIDRDDARTISYGLAYIGPYFVDHDKLTFSGIIEMRIRGGATLYYIMRDRRLEVRRSGPRPDWHLSVDPVTWILVATERKNQWAAALSGKIIGWGRRPLLPFKLRAATFQG